jgi:hypothetical protein
MIILGFPALMDVKEADIGAKLRALLFKNGYTGRVRRRRKDPIPAVEFEIQNTKRGGGLEEYRCGIAPGRDGGGCGGQDSRASGRDGIHRQGAWRDKGFGLSALIVVRRRTREEGGLRGWWSCRWR